MWTWRSLGPACSLHAQDQPSHIEALDVMPLSLLSRVSEIEKGRERDVSKRSWAVRH